MVASAIRVANVFTHFGFVTGDDVEIHEMTLGVALGKAWPVWDLRNAFYPMTFIFPVQRALVELGRHRRLLPRRGWPARRHRDRRR